MFDSEKNITLVNTLDKVTEKGAVINGKIVVSVADVDLVFLGLRLILTSISKAEELSGNKYSCSSEVPTPEELEYINKLQREIRNGATDFDETLFNKLLLEAYAVATNNGLVVVNNKQEIIVINKRFSELKNVDLITMPLKNSKGEYYGRLWGFREETYYILVVKEKTGCQMKR